MYQIEQRNLFPYDLFNEFWGTPAARAYPMHTDIRAEGDRYVMDVEVPGVKKEDIDISYKDEYLTISVKQEKEQKDHKNYLLWERRYTATRRNYYVGEIDRDGIQASYENGILTVSFPKESKKETPYQISIS